MNFVNLPPPIPNGADGGLVMEQNRTQIESLEPLGKELDDATLLSRMISVLRFPLIVAIVCIHAHIPEPVVGPAGDHAGYAVVYDWLAQVVARVAVPLFFLISGYLFFLKVERLTFSVYGHKLLTRLRTLFVPYIWWNVAAVLITFLFHTYVFHFRSAVPDWDWSHWMAALWDYRGGMPYNYPLWYIRNLMLMAVSAPLQWWLLKRLPYPTLCLAGVCWFLSGDNTSATVFFFMLGAWLGMIRRPFGWLLWRWAWPAVSLYMVWSVVEVGWGRAHWASELHQLGVVLGAVSLMGLSARYVAWGGRQWKWLQASGFWVYATHVIVLGPTQTWLFRSYRPVSDAGLISVYVAQIVWATGLGIAFYALLHKCLPRLTAWLTGGR